MADRISPEKRSLNMSKIRGSNTKPEMLLRSELHKLGFRFRLHGKNLPGRPDIVLQKYGAVIFVNGCFWHRHEGCRNATTPKTNTEFWNTKFSETVERDKRCRKELEASGWRVETVWECEIKDNLKTCSRNLSRKIMAKKQNFQ